MAKTAVFSISLLRAATFDKLLGRTWAGPGQDKSKTGQDKQNFWKLSRTFKKNNIFLKMPDYALKYAKIAQNTYRHHLEHLIIT